MTRCGSWRGCLTGRDTPPSSQHSNMPFRLLQGDLNHWIPLLNAFDDILEEATKDRPELSLANTEPGSQPQPAPFPLEPCLAALRTTAVVLDHCSNKHLYQSHEVRGAGCRCPLRVCGMEARDPAAT